MNKGEDEALRIRVWRLLAADVLVSIAFALAILSDGVSRWFAFIIGMFLMFVALLAVREGHP